MQKIKLSLFVTLMLLFSGVKAQDLMDMLSDETPSINYTYATFKTTRIVLGQSVENPAKGTLQFLVEHNFGKLNEGAYNMWGLDRSTIRLGLEYGVNDRLSLSVGRSTYEKTVDGALKYKILRQSSGSRNMPLSLSLYAGTALNGLKWADTSRTNYFSSRLSYVTQLLIARKFSNAISLQLTPTMIHKNLIATRNEKNDMFAMGIGGRFKVTQRTTLNAEYFYLLPGSPADIYTNCLSVGCDIETGGHVFQFRLSNAQPMFEQGFVGDNTEKWSKGDIYFGFTINRVFTIVK